MTQTTIPAGTVVKLANGQTRIQQRTSIVTPIAVSKKPWNSRKSKVSWISGGYVATATVRD
jgi:DNA-directed RNA polymerase